VHAFTYTAYLFMEVKMITQNENSSADLKTKITEHIQELAKATDAAHVSQEMRCYLDMCASFHQYSPCNVWLILMSCPSASYVAGFKKWLSMGRFVRKGEHGIPILAPIISTITNEKGEEEQCLVGFKVVYVFDVSQTDGEPLPEPPNWKSPEKNAELMNNLTRFAYDKAIQIQVKHIGHDIQGVSMGGKIFLDPEAGTKTLIHEIAHEILHHVEGVLTSSTNRELEAESVAYVVAKHFGLNSLSSPNYNALHGATSKMILEHLERIQNTATDIIHAVETELEVTI
jgi:antirestriction protein ArdC